MSRSQQGKQGPKMLPGDAPALTLEQQRNALAVDIALLVVRQYRRHSVSRESRADSSKSPVQQDNP
jgi:hypothetical protein